MIGCVLIQINKLTLKIQKSICIFKMVCTINIRFRHLNFGIKEGTIHSISPLYFQYHYATWFFTDSLLVKMKGNINKKMAKKMKRRKKLDVATLAFGSRPKQGLAKVRDKREARETHLILLGVQESVREWTLTLSRQLPLGELESQWTPKFLGSNCKGQNPLDWRIFYIIGKLLRRRCLKWACITHLDFWNTSYGQKKGQESNWQLDSQPLKVRNRPHLLLCRWRATYHWKALNKGYNFSLDLISIRGLHTKLWVPKVVGVPTLGISGLPFGSLGTKCHLDVGLMERHRVYYKGEGGGFPQVWAMMSLVSSNLPVVRLSTKSAPTMH